MNMEITKMWKLTQEEIEERNKKLNETSIIRLGTEANEWYYKWINNLDEINGRIGCNKCEYKYVCEVWVKNHLEYFL